MTLPRLVLPLLAGLVLAFTAAAPPTGAQPTAPAGDARPPDSGANPGPGVPAPAPPAPADLSAAPGPAQPPPAPPRSPPPAVPPGLEALPQGGLRLRFAAGAEGPPPAALDSLTELGRSLGAGPPGRVVLTGQASGPAADVSAARRLSLARALAVKQALAAGGLPATRIDIRPLGRTADAVDAVDVQPPEPEPGR